MYQLHSFNFPREFIFGVADADLQVIGEKHTIKIDNSEPTMWNHFARIPGRIFNNDSPLEGIDRFHRFREDVQILKTLGIKHYRTSVSMARTISRSRKPNLKALYWYKNYFEDLRKSGIKIYLTLYHWELPQYLSKKGGWKKRETSDYFVEHAKIVYEHLNEFIEEYFILNEPFQSTFDSYHTGCHAPGEKNLKGALASVHYTLLAQGRVFHLLKSLNKNLKISTVYNPTITYAASNIAKDIKAAEYAFGYQTLMFTDPIYRGEYPKYMMELFEDKMPEILDNDMKIIKIGEGLHSFGVNFYRGKVVEYDPTSDVNFSEVRYPQGIKNGLGWPVSIPPTYSEALYDLLCALNNRYQNYGMKRIYITENGTCWNDKIGKDGKVDDEFRIFYIREHLKQVQKSILARVPIKGYFLWTLMDNFEWEYGYQPGSNFGIVYINRTTLNRVPKKSFYWYKELINTNVIPE